MNIHKDTDWRMAKLLVFEQYKSFQSLELSKHGLDTCWEYRGRVVCCSGQDRLASEALIHPIVLWTDELPRILCTHQLPAAPSLTPGCCEWMVCLLAQSFLWLTLDHMVCSTRGRIAMLASQTLAQLGWLSECVTRRWLFWTSYMPFLLRANTDLLPDLTFHWCLGFWSPVATVSKT